MVVGLLLRSLCSSTRRSLSSSSSSSPFKSSLLLQRIPGLNNRHFSAAAAAVPACSAAPGRSFDPTRLRNVAVIGHVGHGKTTLMDRLRRQCGADITHERALDNISLERERGITISSKVTSIPWGEHELHMVDIPGNSDFEAEQVVSMVQGAVLVVDAGEGPLPQTELVLAKALKYDLRPLVLLNKVDRPSVSEERCDEVKRLVFELFIKLGATTEKQWNFPVLYASAKEGWASSTFTKSPPENSKNMTELLDAIVKHVPSPTANLEAPFQMLDTSLPCGEHELPSDFGDDVQLAEFERWLSFQMLATSSPCGEHEGVIWSFDWRSLGAITPIRNQGDFNTCWAFAAITTVEALHFIRSGELLALSEQQLIDCDQCNQDCNIGSVTDAYNYIAQHGITLQDIYPYTGIISTCRMELVAQKKVEISGYEYVDFSENEVRLLQAVSRQPVSIVVHVPLSWKEYKGGYIYDVVDHKLNELLYQYPNLSDSLETHVVVVVGYGVDGDEGYVIIRNSWGAANWGEDGYIRMKFGVGIFGFFSELWYPV